MIEASRIQASAYLIQEKSYCRWRFVVLLSTAYLLFLVRSSRGVQEDFKEQHQRCCCSSLSMRKVILVSVQIEKSVVAKAVVVHMDERTAIFLSSFQISNAMTSKGPSQDKASSICWAWWLVAFVSLQWAHAEMASLIIEYMPGHQYRMAMRQ